VPAIATVQRERDPQFFTVITAELEAVETTAGYFLQRPLSLYAPASRAVLPVTLKQQRI
jgi:hypothetical protein